MSEIPVAQPVPVQGTVVGVTPPPVPPAISSPVATPPAAPTANFAAPTTDDDEEIDTLIQNKRLYFFQYAPDEIVKYISRKRKDYSFETTKIWVMLVNSPSSVTPLISIAPVEDWRNPVTGFIRYNYVNCGPDGYQNYKPTLHYETTNVLTDPRYTLIKFRFQVPIEAWAKLNITRLFKLGKLGNNILRSPLMAASALGTGLSAVGNATGQVIGAVADNTIGAAVRTFIPGFSRYGRGGARSRKHIKNNRSTRKHIKKNKSMKKH